jgi:hypothetical protein
VATGQAVQAVPRYILGQSSLDYPGVMAAAAGLCLVADVRFVRCPPRHHCRGHRRHHDLRHGAPLHPPGFAMAVSVSGPAMEQTGRNL